MTGQPAPVPPSDLPDIGTYWTAGSLPTYDPMHFEAYSTCARCGAFVNSKDRHEDWHLLVEAGDQAALARAWAEGKTADAQPAELPMDGEQA